MGAIYYHADIKEISIKILGSESFSEWPFGV